MTDARMWLREHKQSAKYPGLDDVGPDGKPLWLSVIFRRPINPDRIERLLGNPLEASDDS